MFVPVDGIKIYLPYLEGWEWINNELLSFNVRIDVDTGEVLGGVYTAKLKGLIFTVTISKDSTKTTCIVRGSLHKYHNEGLHNANDFTYLDLLEVLQELRDLFHIDPDTAIIQNLEPSILISIPIPVSKLFKNVLTQGNKPFSQMTIKDGGKGRTVKRRQYAIKLYDKGSQHPEIAPVDNLMRFEIAVKKMEFLSKYGVVYLSDLLDLEKLEGLKDLVLKYWNEIIYFDKYSIPYRRATNREQKNILYYSNPRTWVNFNSDNRYKAKRRISEMMAKFDVTDFHSEIGAMIARKYGILEAVKRGCFDHDFQPFESEKRRCFDRLDNWSKHRLFTIQDTTHIFCPKHTPISFNPTPTHSDKELLKTTSQNNEGFTNGSPAKGIKDNNPVKNDTHIYFAQNSAENEHAPTTRQCKVCGVGISHKIKRAVYCGRQCNNAYHSKIRKMKRKEVKESEIQILDNLLEGLHSTNLSLSITYKNGSIQYTDTLEQKEIKATPTLIRKVTKVVIHTSTRPVTLTSHRAKSLIKSISELNKSKVQ